MSDHNLQLQPHWIAAHAHMRNMQEPPSLGLAKMLSLFFYAYWTHIKNNYFSKVPLFKVTWIYWWNQEYFFNKFSEKKINFIHLELPFKMHKIIFFQKKKL